jgi:argininosuccinate synthase
VWAAQRTHSDALAHGCTGKGNDQVRIDVSARALNPKIRVIAPARVWNMSRPDEIEYARQRGIPVPATKASPYSTDENLWGRSIECGVLEDPWTEPPEEIYALTKSPADAPDVPAYVEIEFARGVPTHVNGVAMPFAELIGSLETIAGAHGVGRIDMLENRLVGIKSREIYEAPAAVVLHTAHRELENMVIPRDLQRLKRQLSQVYADLVYNGLWFTQTREAIDAFVRSVQQRVDGTVRLKLFKGDCRVVGRKSPYSLYEQGLATYEAGDLFDHTAAEGFIKIWGLPVEIAARKAPSADAEDKRAPIGSDASTRLGVAPSNVEGR